jgi:acyl-CoA synthetase (AMP-forming)/AMP-acid ligase II
MPDVLLHELFAAGAAGRADAVALVHGDRRYTHGELHAGGARLGQLFVAEGVRPGDRIGIVIPNSAEYVHAWLGCLMAGAVAVPLHADNDAASLHRMLDDADATTVVGHPRTAVRLAEVARAMPQLRVVDAAHAAEHPPKPPGVALTPDHRAVIIYTSGSTGAPRGAVLRHRSLVANTRSIVDYLRLGPEDRISVVLPFSYVYGMSLLNTHLAVGGALVLHDSLLFTGAVLDTMEREQVTGFAGVPSTFAILLNRSDLAERELPHLRYVTQAGGAMPVPHVQRLREAVPGAEVVVMYGATEASARLSYVPPSRLAEKLGSIGVPIPGVTLRIRRADGTDADVDEVGEVCARGENVMEGYWQAPDATAEVLVDGELRTGDLGRRDTDGYFWLVGRSREMIKSGGHRVSPQEIEEHLLAHEAVHEVAVVGIPDEYAGELIVAHVTPRPGMTLTVDALGAFARTVLPPHKVPARFELHRDLPRNANGKLDRRALRERG